jgi:asparagine synthase (glutamine-hydrolysing)
MTLFAGLVHLDGSPISRKDEEGIGRICGGGSAPAERRRTDEAEFFQRPATHGEKSEQRLCTRRDGRVLYVGLARLDNRDEIGAALNLSASELASTCDGDLLCSMFERRGEAGVARCLGAFAFAYWDSDTRHLTLCRDYLGRRLIVFHRSGDRLIFTSSLPRLLAIPGVPRELDPIQIANRLALNYEESRQTIYRHIERVPSRTMLTIAPNGLRYRNYWQPNFDAPSPYRREEDYIARARELFDLAVATATAGQPHVAIATSGGLDSSAIAATVARLGRAGRITCYTQLPAEDYDVPLTPRKYRSERDKLLALGRMYPQIELRFLAEDSKHRHIGDDVRIFAPLCQPIHGVGNAAWYFPFYDAIAADAHDTVQLGLWGNFGLSWLGPSWLLTLLKTGQFATCLHEVVAAGRESGRGPLRTLISEGLLRGMPRSVRESLDRLRGRKRKGDFTQYSALKRSFVEDAGLVKLWNTGGSRIWWNGPGWNPARFRAYALFDCNQAARDDTANNREFYGFAIRDAHADRRLLEFLLSVPEYLYHRNGIPRSFARAVLADRLPAEILRERRMGDQGGAWFRRLNPQRQAMAADLERIEASPLAREILDLPRMKRLIEEWPTDEYAAQKREDEYRFLLMRGVHVGRFIRWAEGSNA